MRDEADAHDACAGIDCTPRSAARQRTTSDPMPLPAEENDMRAIRTVPFLSMTALAALVAILPRAGRADVTVQQQTQFDFAIIKAHGTTTESTTTDKRRSDSDMHCEGFMSMFCGNTQSGEIVRLDRN